MTFRFPIALAFLCFGCDGAPLAPAEEIPLEAPVVEALEPVSGEAMDAPAFEAPQVQMGWVVDSFGFLYEDDEGGVDALDIDGVQSPQVEGSNEGMCAHEDFRTSEGQGGVDHQFLRVTSTFESLLKDGIADLIISNSAKDGSMTLLVTADDEVVRLVIGADAPLTGNDGEVLPFSSFRPYPDTAYHAELALNSSEGGVHVAGPGDVRLRLNIQIVEADLFLSDAYVRVEVADDGRAHGVIQGYWSIESIIEILASTSAHLLALGYTREEFEAVLADYADGDLDDMGACHSLSAAFRFTAVPAYLLQEGGDE